MTIETVLVTGSSGFIGFAVARALAQAGRAVVGLDPAPLPSCLSGVTTVRKGLSDMRQMSELLCSRRIKAVIHAGGVSGPMLARDDPYAICEANVFGTVNLIEASRSTRVRRFVYCSSSSAFGDTLPAPVSDDAPLRPNNLYGATISPTTLKIKKIAAIRKSDSATGGRNWIAQRPDETSGLRRNTGWKRDPGPI